MGNAARSLFKRYKKSQSDMANDGVTRGTHSSKTKPRRLFSWIVLICISAALFGAFVFTILMVVLSIGLPDVNQFDKLAGTQSTVIYDRDGGILYTLHGEENRKYVAISEISPFLQKATVAIEDDQFYYHSGFDVQGIAAAVLHQIGIGNARGGSTITQQLAKNSFLSPERSYTRKLKELILAVRLERSYDKNKILELYLNRIPYGSNAYGSEMASHLYFDKPARELTLAESAVLAGLPQLPTYYSPYGPHLYSKLERELTPDTKPDDITNKDYTGGLIGKAVTLPNGSSVFLPGRADVVLRRMNELGLISKNEQLAAGEELQKLVFIKHSESFKAGHFVFEVRNQLETMLGKDVLAQGGLQVHTTLDPKLQTVAEAAVKAGIEKAKTAYDVSTGALFSINAKTGEILSMVGAADYFDEESHGAVNHVMAKRQPGSSFKPFIYAKAFMNRAAPATVVYDTPTDFGSYKPKNYDGKFMGPMTIRRALAQSRNIPAIKAYFMAGQQPEIMTFLKGLGFETLNPDVEYGPSLALGSGETSLYDMVRGYSVFATGGLKREPYSIVKVTSNGGKVLYDHAADVTAQTPPAQVMDAQVAYLISSVLSDHSVNLGQRLNIAGHTVAVKTGTSTSKESKTGVIYPSNLWAIGYTPTIVTGVWAGNSDGKDMKVLADGYTVAAPVWNEFMTAALKDVPDEKFAVPEGIVTATVSNMSGLLPSADTPDSGKITDVFASFSKPTEVDSSYKKIKVVKDDGLLPNEFTPEDQIEERAFVDHKDMLTTFPSWLDGVRVWVKNRVAEDPTFPGFPPTETTKTFTEQTMKNKPTIQIKVPSAYAIITGKEFSVEVEISAPNNIKKVQYFIGDRSVANVTKFKAPFNTTLKFSKSNLPGTYVITAKVTDDVGYSEVSKVEIKYQPLDTPAVPTAE